MISDKLRAEIIQHDLITLRTQMVAQPRRFDADAARRIAQQIEDQGGCWGPRKD